MDDIILRSEAELDAVFGAVPKVFERPAKIDWSTIDPFAWPVCKSCGNRRAELLVERGHECRACFIARIDRVVRLLRPLRRDLPDGRKLTLVA